jgi:hypothetical protein
MGGVCFTHGICEKFIQNCSGKREGKDPIKRHRRTWENLLDGLYINKMKKLGEFFVVHNTLSFARRSVLHVVN